MFSEFTSRAGDEVLGNGVLTGGVFRTFDDKLLPLILLQIPEKKYRLEAFAVDVINVQEQVKQTGFTDIADFHAWLEDMLGKADVNLMEPLVDQVNFSGNHSVESIKAFVTCSYNRFSNERTICFAH